MDAARKAREQKKQKLLFELAELMIEEQVEQGVFLGTPHYSIIEQHAIKLGCELSRKAQERGAREVAANAPVEAVCPTCQTKCPVQTQARSVTSLHGPVDLTETTAYCNRCRRSFFPSAGETGAR